MPTTATFSTATGVLAAKVGRPFHHSLAAAVSHGTGVTAAWTWTLNGATVPRSPAGTFIAGLPSGMLALPIGNETLTGAATRFLSILGTPTQPGLWRLSVGGTAVSNSLEVILAVEPECPIDSSGGADPSDDPAASVLAVDLVACTVEGQTIREPIPGAAPAGVRPGPVLFGKRGDSFPVVLKFSRGGIPVNWPGLEQAFLGIKEYAGETLFPLNDGTVEQGPNSATIRLTLSDALAAVLASYPGDMVEAFDAVAEIEFRAAGGIKKTTRTFLFSIERDLYV